MTPEKFEEVFYNLPGHGWLNHNEAECLVRWASTTKGAMVEVGSYQGRSAVLLAQLEEANKQPRTLYCVDPWDDLFSTDLKGEEIYERFLANTSGMPVIPVRTRVEDCQPIRAEFVYLDGDHSYEGTLAQILFAKSCSAKVIAIHDVDNTGGGAEVKRAALRELGKWNEKVGRLAVWSCKQ